MFRTRSKLLMACMTLVACGGDDAGADGNGTSGTAATETSAESSATNPATTGESSGQPATSAVDSTTGSGATATGTDSTGASGTDSGETGAPACPYAPTTGEFGLTLVATGFDRPVQVVGDPQVPDRLFVVEQGGSIKILEPGANMAPEDPFLELDSHPGNPEFIGDERGLLGFALHADFPADPRVYVAYQPGGDGSSPRLRIEEYQLAEGDPAHADPASARTVMELDDLASNHNGGMLTFGPDGWLYIATGDGGQGGDFYMTGQNTTVADAKILRIGVEPDGEEDNPLACPSCMRLGPFDYTIPEDNPFASDPAQARETYAWGFRNPWRFAFDSLTGELYVADVGQGDREEVDVVAMGANYGWSDMEGFDCYNDNGCDVIETPNATNVDDLTMPIIDYSHSNGRCSVTGGAVYRSCEVEDWQGVYVYGDFCSGELFGLRWDGTEVEDLGVLLDTGERILGNGWNAWGDVYITTVETEGGTLITDGKIYRVSP